MKHPDETGDQLFLESLAEGAASLGVELSGEGLARIQAHRRELKKWAQRMNLTTVCDPEGMAELVYLDSMVLLPHLDSQASLHDVGSGAGFPGLVAKALRPDLSVVLTEARQKKVTFLRHAAREMELSDGLKIFCRRLGHDPVEPQAGSLEVVSRAAFPPAEWVRLGSPLVARGGRLWIFSGQPIDNRRELDEGLDHLLGNLPGGFVLADRVSYRLPRTAKDRLLVSLRRTD